jgi:(S)-ureidoglycine aminohydrolase
MSSLSQSAHQSARTRSALAPTHLLHTPESFVRTPLPGLSSGLAIVHACPALGARFIWMTIELDRGGAYASAINQRLLYILEGEASLTLDTENYTEGAPQTHQLKPGCYAYLAPGESATLMANTVTRLVLIEKVYEPLHGVESPRTFVGEESALAATALSGDPDLTVRALLPADFAFDFAVNTMTYAPGTALSQVEIHYMEHGLLMLEGSGPYLLNDTTYETRAGDFIWMAPYCPQWFQATSETPAKYLIYKNFNRSPAL